MRKVFSSLLLATLVCFQLNCSTGTTANDSSAQTNAEPTPISTPETNQTVAKAEETPLPTFTNADEALAAGRKLLDELESRKAVEALRQAVKLNPDLAEAHFDLGIAYALLEKELEDNPPPAGEQPTPTPRPARKGKKEIVALTDSEKSFENAVKAYKKILAKSPKDDQAHFNLGRSYNKLNQDPEALKSLKEAVKLKPDDSEYQTELGVILIKLAQYAEAVAALKKAIELDQSNLQAESLLERAEAGRKRVDFGNKPKPPQAQQAQVEQSRPRGNSRPPTNPKPPGVPPPPPPPTKNANQ